MIKCFIASFLFYSSVINADCGSLKEGETIRLDVQGKSLENFRVQDQDGLGTCYSNAASLLIHSVTGITPSYLMMAKNFGEKKEGELKDFYFDKDYDRYVLKLEGGEICDTIKESKKKQAQGNFLCKQSSTYYELNATKVGDPADAQKNMLTAFLNWENTSKNKTTIDKTSFEAFKSNAEFKCKKIDPEFLARELHSVFVDVFEENAKTCWNGKYFWESSNAEKEEYKKCEILYDFYKTFFGVNPRIVPSLYGNVLLPPKDKLQFENLSNKILDKIKNFKKSPTPTIDFFRNIGVTETWVFNTKLSPELAKHLQKCLSIWDNAFLHLDSMKKLAKNLEDQSKGISSKECVNFEILQSLENQKDQIISCGYQGVFKDMYVLGAYQNDFFDNLLNGILSFQPSKVFKEIGLDCDPNNRSEIPSNLDCEEPKFIDQLPDGSYTPAVITGNDVQKIKNEHSQKIINSLKSNLAIGYSFCTDILDKRNANYLQSGNKREMCRIFHGHHAVSVTGVICNNNQLSYLIQNSWGTKWTPGNPDLKSEPNGKFWMSEQDFFNNAESLTYLKKL